MLSYTLPALVPLLALVGLAGAVQAQTTVLVTNGIDGPSDGISLYPELSADGRYIIYQSDATNLVADDTNGVPDCFLYDAMLGTTKRVSVSSAGAQADGGGLEPVISLDNRYVAFYSFASDLVPGDSNGHADIFLHHLPTATTTLISVGMGGAEANGGSRYPVISYFGRYVGYESKASNLVPGDTNEVRDVFVYDKQTGVTTRASTSAAGMEGDGDSVDAFISPDGRHVAFESSASNLVPGDTNGVTDVFVKDLQTGAIFRASVDSSGVEGNDSSQDCAISDLGLVVSFSSHATNLVANDANGYEDIFLHFVTTGVTERMNVASDGTQGHVGGYTPFLSPDGGFGTFVSAASNLVNGDTNSTLDVFVRDIAAGTTERVSVGSLGQQGFGECSYPGLDWGARYVVFDSGSENLVTGDVNGTRDIFLHDRYSPFRPFCAGDGSLATPCPCGNFGAPGHGCENTAGAGGATLVASGTPSLDTVVFHSNGLPASTVTVLLQAPVDSSSPGISFGDGVLCGSGALKRLYIKVGAAGAITAPEPGDLTVMQRSSEVGDVLTAGTRRYYQVYYRDASATFCPPKTFNISNAIEVLW
jgi:Tol biopolymer transport system component